MIAHGRKVFNMKNLRPMFVLFGVAVVIYAAFTSIANVVEKSREPQDLTKGAAEARSSILFREPAECWGEKAGWQCLNKDRSKLVSCLGTDCYRLK
jgi:hypothetical protein